MRELDVGGVIIDECRFCDGLWLDAGEPEALVCKDGVSQQLEPIGFDDSRKLLDEGHRFCPRCYVVLEVFPINGERVDVCAQCRGLFLDRWELQRVLKDKP